MIREAVISHDGVYRYSLIRSWADGGVLDMWIMLNPSTADAEIDDPTIRRCMNFSRSWGADGIRVANLFALRATDPTELAQHPEPTGPSNDFLLTHAVTATTVRGGRIIAAWGAHPMAVERTKTVRPLLGDSVKCLGFTKAGAPRHPLYVKGDTELVNLP